VRGAKHLEDLVQAFLTDDVPDAHDLGVLGRYQHRQIALGDLQAEVGLLDSFEETLFDCLDQCGPVVGVNNGLSAGEKGRNRSK